MAFQMTPEMMGAGGGAFGGGAGSTGGFSVFTPEGGISGGVGDSKQFDLMQLFGGLGKLGGAGGKKPMAPAGHQQTPMKEASPIPIALNLPTALQIQSGFPSVTARLFGGMRG